MKIIISPTKKMRVDTDNIEITGMPVYIEETERLLAVLKGYSFEELKTLFAANDAITKRNYERYREMKLDTLLTPAVLAYTGLQYQSMAPNVFTSGQWEYVKKHLYILSGFYGILNACDGVVPYRLEMQARLPVDGYKNLYEFWGDKLCRRLINDDQTVINLASKEYSKAIEPYLTPDITYITCVFAESVSGRPKVKATAAKMARGAMVRWLAEQEITDAEQIKMFRECDYSYSEELSTEREWVFLNLKGNEDEYRKIIRRVNSYGFL